MKEISDKPAMGLLNYGERQTESPLTPTRERPMSMHIIGIKRKQETAESSEVCEEVVRVSTPNKGYGLRGRIGRLYTSQDEITYFTNEDTGITYRPGGKEHLIIL